MAKILYCAPVWYGFSSAADQLNKLESFLRRCKRTGYCTPDMATVTEQMNDGDDKLIYSDMVKMTAATRRAGDYVRIGYLYCVVAR